MRTEKDILGTMELADDCLYGINTARAAENFKLGGKTVNPELILAIVTVKKAAAMTYQKLEIRPELYGAVIKACDRVKAALEKEETFVGSSEKETAAADGNGPAGKAAARMDRIPAAFPTQALQGGAGTSTNMNVNEVLANLALIELGHKPGEYEFCHPLDDVNRGQSTNDVYPTALRIAAIRKLRKLSGECAVLQESLQKKENEFDGIRKLGRTELMDAVPITLGEEFGAFAQGIARDRWRLYKTEERLRQINLGGAAVGLNNLSMKQYRFGVVEELRRLTDIGLAEAEYPMDLTQNQDVFTEVSGLLKALSVNLSKIAGDLRLMASGPNGGLGELHLKELQQGSTIMPGKINPVIPEMVIQVSIRVRANDVAVSEAASRGEFELNAFEPLIADALLESLDLLTEAVRLLRTKCIDLLSANPDRCARHLKETAAFGAAYLSRLGYERTAEIIRSNPPDKAEEILKKLSEDLQDSEGRL